MRKWLTLFLTVVLITPGAHANEANSDLYDGPARWAEFDKFMKEREQQDRITGLSYLISGGVATIGGVAGYYSSEDAFSRGMYAVSQSVGIAAIGYGASVYWIGNEYNSFYKAVARSSLSPSQKSELLKYFLEQERERKEAARWIRVGTHALLAAVNFYNASKESDRDVKNLFNFLGGVNLVIGLSYTF